MTYSDKLKNPKWQKKRLEIFQRDEFTCKNCGSSESQLQVHHLHYIPNANPWEYENDKLLTLCESCHNEFTSINNEIRENIGKITNTDTLGEVNELIKNIGNSDPLLPKILSDFSIILKNCDYPTYNAICAFSKSFIKHISNE